MINVHFFHDWSQIWLSRKKIKLKLTLKERDNQTQKSNIKKKKKIQENDRKNIKIKMWKKQEKWANKEKIFMLMFSVLLATNMFDLTTDYTDHFKSVLTWSNYSFFWL